MEDKKFAKLEPMELPVFKLEDLKDLPFDWNKEDTLSITAGSGYDSIMLGENNVLPSFDIGTATFNANALPGAISTNHLINNATSHYPTIQPLTTQQISQLNTINIQPNTTYGGYGHGHWTLNQTTPSLAVKGDAEFEGDIKLKGKSLNETLDHIEQRLGILHPNPELEEKWEELKALSTRYRELEKDIIEKEKLWSMLKK